MITTEPVTVGSLRKGDFVIVEGPDFLKSFTVREVKTVEGDEEIILRSRDNVWFSSTALVEGRSWIKDARRVVCR